MQDKITWMHALLQSLPFEVMSEENLRESIRDFGFDHFIDPAFPPDDTSIWVETAKDPYYPLQTKPVWKRPTEFMESTPQLFLGGIDPNDINQGVLGNCWFLASISSIAENPALVRRLFITKEYNKEGIYRLKIWK